MRPFHKHLSALLLIISLFLSSCSLSKTKDTTYRIDFDLNGGTSNLYSGPKIVNEFAKDIFFFDCEKENYNFRGWLFEDKKIFDERGELLNTPKMKNEMVFLAQYSQTAKINIISNIENAGVFYGEGEYQYNSYAEISVKVNQGYSFIGWFLNDVLVSNQEIYGYALSNKDITFEARFEINYYDLHIYSAHPLLGKVKIANSSEYEIEETQLIQYLAPITISSLTITSDCRFLGWFNDNNELISSDPVYSFQMVNYNYALIARWDAPKFEVNVQSNDTSLGIVSGGGIFEYNSTVTVIATPVGESIFKGWYLDEQLTNKISDDNTYSFVVDYSNITLFAEFWSRQKAWDIAHGVIPTLSDDKKTVTYGLYPQTYLRDVETKNYLNNLDDSFKSPNGWYFYNNEYYACQTVISDNLEEDGSIREVKYWFKCEPIVWRILSNNDGHLLLLSNIILDARCYHSSQTSRTINENIVYSNNYMYSDVRAWLNNYNGSEYGVDNYSTTGFYGSAFYLDSSYIDTVTVDNTAPSNPYIENIYGCEDTNDKVFLLSYDDYTNWRYGFSTDAYNVAKSRECKKSYYATVKESPRDYWTRSPGANENNSWVVDSATGLMGSGYYVDGSKGIRPAISINFNL